MDLDNQHGEVVLPKEISKNGARMFVGSLGAAEDQDFHTLMGVTHVLTAAGRLRLNVPVQASGAPPAHISLDLADHPTANLLEVLPKSLDFCDEAMRTGGVILVHCASGVSRSVSIVVAFLMTRCDMSYADALILVRNNRPSANPNLGFERQLQLLAESSCNLQEAAKLWSAQAGQDVMADARAQRSAANSLHAKLDDVENSFAADRSAALANGGLPQAQLSLFRQQLDALQDEIDSCQGESEDRVAKTILKAAAQKVGRLLVELE